MISRRRSPPEGIHGDYAVVILAVLEILGKNLGASHASRCFDNGRVPVGQTEPLLRANRGKDDFNCDGLNRESSPGADEPGGR
ncbi:MAG: hypothetical protein JO232_01805 [Verrucomicrobia bacterium]|nr:hypothetical protein [Verrucomicrobiota bacterium]